MKILFTLILACFVTLPLFAQHQSHEITGVERRSVNRPVSTGKVAVVDTLYDYLDRSTDFFLLTAGSSGYVFGTNGFTEAISVHYDPIGIVKVTEIMVFVTEKEIVGTADSLVAYAYTTFADTTPQSQMSIGKISFADLDTTGFASFIPMQVIDSTADDFILLIDYYANNSIDDSLAILSNNFETANGGPDGKGEDRTRQRLSNGDWLPASDIWNIGGAPLDADALVLPVVDYTEIVAVPEPIRQRDLTLFAAFPQPATSQLTIPFDLARAQQVELIVFDQQGRPIQTTVSRFAEGKNQIVIEREELAAGTYYFRLRAESGALAGKFLFH